MSDCKFCNSASSNFSSFDKGAMRPVLSGSEKFNFRFRAGKIRWKKKNEMLQSFP